MKRPIFAVVVLAAIAASLMAVAVVQATSDLIAVDIDIKPATSPNDINLKSKGLISVAILSTPDFDATSVDPLSVQFGPDGATERHGKGHIVDVDGDGDLDLQLHFRTPETGIAPGDTEASLTGQTFSGQPIAGCDTIRIVP